VNIRPRTVRLKFRTSPAGFKVTVNGQPRRTPVSITSVVGFDHEIGAPDQKRQGRNWTWSSWSDGGAQTHTLRAPAAAAVYTATFRRRQP
jgi:hypothetical protein